jgi:hypothetical protein
LGDRVTVDDSRLACDAISDSGFRSRRPTGIGYFFFRRFVFFAVFFAAAFVFLFFAIAALLA